MAAVHKIREITELRLVHCTRRRHARFHCHHSGINKVGAGPRLVGKLRHGVIALVTLDAIEERERDAAQVIARESFAHKRVAAKAIDR